MRQDSSVIAVTKIAAAQRQLDAAIRMMLSDEDELAVHTVGAASYRILRDLKKKRGRRELADWYARGAYYIARDIMAGKLKGIPVEVAGSPVLVHLIELAISRIRSGEVQSIADLSALIHVRDEPEHWCKFNIPANFLKHADQDFGSALSLDRLDNLRLLVAAVIAYDELVQQMTPEMLALGIYYNSADPDFRSPFLPADAKEKFKSLPPAARRRFCLSLIEIIKQGATTVREAD
jgi:hypothetical protein